MSQLVLEAKNLQFETEYFNSSNQTPFNFEVEEGELDPENKEARTLMSALVQGIEIKNQKLYEDEEFEEVWYDQGIGKDLFGKYAYAEFDHEGKTYQVHVREKSSYNNAVKITQGRIIGPKLIANKKGMN